MMAILKAASTEMGPEFRESGLDIVPRKVRQSEFLQSWAINDRTVRGAEQPHVTGCVATRGEKRRNFPGGPICVRNECVEQRRFSHSRLPDEYGTFSLQLFFQRACIAYCTHYDHTITRVIERDQSISGRIQAGLQVGLVKNNQGFQILMFAGYQCACHQFIAKAWVGGTNHCELRYIGCNKLGAVRGTSD